MYIYGVTVAVDREMAETWLSWMEEIHIPEIMDTGFFNGYTILELLDPVVDQNNRTFNVQYRCPSYDHYQAYLNGPADELRKAQMKKFGQKTVAFRTLLKTIRST